MPATFDEWEKLLEHKEVDVVVSALPVDLHAPCYCDVLAAGKDFYAEKPLGLTVAEGDAAQKAADQSGCNVQVGFQRRADPRFAKPMEFVHDDEIGGLNIIHSCVPTTKFNDEYIRLLLARTE